MEEEVGLVSFLVLALLRSLIAPPLPTALLLCTSWVHASLLMKEGPEAEEYAKKLRVEEEMRKEADAQAKKR